MNAKSPSTCLLQESFLENIAETKSNNAQSNGAASSKQPKKGATQNIPPHSLRPDVRFPILLRRRTPDNSLESDRANPNSFAG
jgi:hypothetical protein